MLKSESALQVSELSHKLGTAEGNCRSMEEELSRLQSQHIQLSKGKSERDVEANELQAKLRSADEKVLGLLRIHDRPCAALLIMQKSGPKLYCILCKAHHNMHQSNDFSLAAAFA